MPKFEVRRAEEGPAQALDPRPRVVQGHDDAPNLAGDTDGHTGMPPSARAEEVALTMMQDGHEDAKKNLYLYEEDMKEMPRVATFLKNLMSYHTTYPNEKEAKEAKKQPKKVKLGTAIGVYLPTIQHIFGVLMFVRLAWIVGSAGFLESFFMVLMCCVTTFVTAISMSAIATNGMVAAGGSYFMISRNLGPESGGAVGICFFLANAFATDLYLLGSIEILLQYMAPSLAIFGDIHTNPGNSYRVYGTVGVILLTIVVAVGVKFVQLFAPFSLACVIISILCIFIGSFQANENTRDVWLCMLGNRLIAPPGSAEHGVTQSHANDTVLSSGWCSNETGGALWAQFCYISNDTQLEVCTDHWRQASGEIAYIPGIPGITSGVVKSNLYSYYLESGEVEPGIQGSPGRGEVVADMTVTFVALCAIYFPSVTGIMTGSNMSGDLKDPQASIPVGTILAQLTTSFVYIAFVFLFGCTTEGPLLRDKFGRSQGGQLLAANLAWPTPWVVLVGAFCSTLGAALQCLTSAPRLLQAIARDNIIPFLDVFKVTSKSGEPYRALLLTALIVEGGVLVASLDFVAPVIDVFFLMCYAVVNLTCALQTLLKTPNWRPRFKYYHWTLSLLGVALNLALSIIAGWYYALGAFLIAAFIYKYVEYKGGEIEWGDGISGLSMSAAQKALLKLEEGDPHTKNWRPQLLVLCKVNPDGSPKYKNVFSLASQLKAGKGLTVVAAVLQGNYLEMAEMAARTKQTFKELMAEVKVKGFAKVMITPDVTQGLDIFVQTVGLGGLRHNTVMVGWPYGWRESTQERSWKVFLDSVRVVTAKDLALLVPRGIENFPQNTMRLNGSIDVWWIVHDGGMLILLSFLLKEHKVWRGCSLRIFTVAQMQDNSIQLKKDLETFLYQLRINASVHVEEMHDSDISAYTVERTLDMEKRSKMLREMKLLKRRGTIQEIVDLAHRPSSPSLKGATNHDDKGEADLDSARSSSPSSSSTSGDDDILADKNVQFTFSPADAEAKRLSEAASAAAKDDIFTPTSIHHKAETAKVVEPIALGKKKIKFNTGTLHTRSGSRIMRMHTAVRLNQAIRKKSGDAELVILNFPAPPPKLEAEDNYMEYLEALSEGLERVLMVRGSGREVVTIYS